uniref:Uncharacterized protein n=1 Tax=Sarcophilus harrisii TaxID=9305 RepID=A0A7N4P396_SARHA
KSQNVPSHMQVSQVLTAAACLTRRHPKILTELLKRILTELEKRTALSLKKIPRKDGKKQNSD